MERKWNENGTKMERKWNENRDLIEWTRHYHLSHINALQYYVVDIGIFFIITRKHLCKEYFVTSKRSTQTTKRSFLWNTTLFLTYGRKG